MIEVWKDIPEYEGLYQVSNLGRVKSLGNDKSKKEKILKPQKTRSGYFRVILWTNGTIKNYMVHKLIAQAFIPNPNNLPEVNHKDENKTNNSVENLEWCNREYNCNYGKRNKSIGDKHSRPVVQIALDDTIVKIWLNMREAGKNGFTKQCISACCRGKRKTHKGYKWQYANP